MSEHTLTRSDLERMAAAAADVVRESERKTGADGARAAVLPILAEGRPATVEELAAAAGRSRDEFAAALRAQRNVEWDTGGRVVGMGMTLSPTPHTVEVDGHLLYAWCAPAALGIMPAFGLPVRVSSPCHATGQTVTVTARPDGVQDVRPPEAVVSGVVTGDADDVRGSMCSLAHFFVSRDAASGWLDEHPDGALLTVPDAFYFALRATQLVLAGVIAS
jgi:alkylmercury lyase